MCFVAHKFARKLDEPLVLLDAGQMEIIMRNATLDVCCRSTSHWSSRSFFCSDFDLYQSSLVGPYFLTLFKLLFVLSERLGNLGGTLEALQRHF